MYYYAYDGGAMTYNMSLKTHMILTTKYTLINLTNSTAVTL